MTSAIFTKYLFEIYFVYGLSFVLLGCAALLHLGDFKVVPIARHFWLIGAFGLLHGAKEFLDAWVLLTNSAGTGIVWADSSLLLLSYLALFEFARRAAETYGSQHAVDRGLLTSLWIYMPLSIGMLFLAGIASDGVAGLGAGIRYLFGFPGAVLAGLMLYRAFDANRSAKFILAGAIAVYGVVGGLITADVAGFPDWLPTNTSFLEATGIPVQLLRATCALAAALSLVVLVRDAARSAMVQLGEKTVALQDLAKSLEQRIDERTAKLQERERFLRDAQRIAQIGSWELDHREDILTGSQEIHRIFEIDAAQDGFNRKACLNAVHPDDQAFVKSVYVDLIANHKPSDINCRLRMTDGRIKWIHGRAESKFDAYGTPLFSCGTIQDITEQKRASQALRESERRLRKSEMQRISFLEAMPDAFVSANQRGEIVYVNAQAERMFGYSKAEMYGQQIEMLIPDKAHATHVKHRSDYFQNPKARVMRASMELSARHKDGTEFAVEISLSPMESEGEQFAAAAVRDITAGKAMKEQLLQAQKMQAVGQLTAGIAHDFNNLLTVIIGNLELLVDPTNEVPANHHGAQAALDAAMRGADLTRRLLAFSRKQVLVPRVIAINELVTELQPLLHRTVGEAISIETRLAADPWQTQVDPSQLENSIINVALNARDSMPHGGKLIIETRNEVLDQAYAEKHSEVYPGDYVLLEVSDTGCGIPKNVLEQIFEPFFSTKETGKGTGLGLSMVYGFVKQSLGHINISSEEGRGTTVSVFLPKSESDIAQSGLTSTTISSIPNGDETVLLVEDDAGVRRLGVILLRNLGYQVLEADNGPAALVLMEQYDEIDLLFTDMVMPGGMTGADLAEHARRLRPELKVLYTSGYASTAAEEYGSLQHGDDILHKPYQKRELAQKVRNVLDQG